ncbi:MAG: hypothetical protein KBT66_03735, partial [Amphritea sp.]|nr:hypothetical protein [Amphritea sp.]
MEASTPYGEITTARCSELSAPAQPTHQLTNSPTFLQSFNLSGISTLNKKGFYRATSKLRFLQRSNNELRRSRPFMTVELRATALKNKKAPEGA